MSSYENISILVTTPAYGGQIFVGYLTGILKLERLAREKGFNIDYEYCYNESLIPRARNTLVHTFMNNTKYTHLLCLDGDIEFDPLDIIKMLDFNKPIVGGLYPKKRIDWNKITDLVNNNNETKLTSDDIQNLSKEPVTILLNDSTINLNDDFIETRYTGTGALLVQRQVLDKMREKYENDIYDVLGTKYFRYFDTELKNQVYLSEDYWFCDRWREMGGQIYLYTKFKCRHWGTYAY
jgi:hypothetical protein